MVKLWYLYTGLSAMAVIAYANKKVILIIIVEFLVHFQLPWSFTSDEKSLVLREENFYLIV